MSTSCSPAPTHPAPQALASPERPPSAAQRPHLLSSFRPFSTYGRQIKPDASAGLDLADGKVRLARGAIVDRPRISVASHLAAFARKDAGPLPLDDQQSSWNSSSSRAASSVCKEERVGGSDGDAMDGIEVAADSALVSASEGIEAMQVEDRGQVSGNASGPTMQKKSEAVASGGIDVGEAVEGQFHSLHCTRCSHGGLISLIRSTATGAVDYEPSHEPESPSRSASNSSSCPRHITARLIQASCRSWRELGRCYCCLRRGLRGAGVPQ